MNTPAHTGRRQFRMGRGATFTAMAARRRGGTRPEHNAEPVERAL